MNRKVAQTNYAYCEETIHLKSNVELSYLDLASRLHKIRLNKMFEPNFESFEEFLEEIKISKSTASKLINIWVRFILQFKIAPKLLAEAGGWSVVAEILPHAENKTQAERWLREAKIYKQSDLRKNLKENKTGIDMRLCKHPDVEIITFKKCKVCGDTERIYDEETYLR